MLMDADEARAVSRNTDFAHFVPAPQNETTKLALEFRKTSIRPAQSFEYKDPFMERVNRGQETAPATRFQMNDEEYYRLETVESHCS